MIEAELTQLVAAPIFVHAWKPDRSAVAISASNEQILIFSQTSTPAGGRKWVLAHTLAEHEQKVTGLDWATGPDGADRLLSCSSDRNAYVWAISNGQWRPQLVLLRFKRAATCAQWNSQGTKFAVGGVEGLVAVGHYEADNDWWVCKHLKKGIEGPVLSIAWHQSGILLAAGTLAGQVNLLSAFVEGVDDKAALRSITWAEPQASAAFNSEIMSIQVGSWIHAVSFSKSGEALAWANQDAVITVFYPGSNVQWSLCPTSKNGLPLPFKKLIFLSENVLMAAGHGAVPMILSGSERQEWKVRMVLESEQISSKRTASGTQGRKKSIFEEAALQGRSTAEMSRNLEAEDAPAHMSTITGLDAFEGNRQVSKVVSTGLDGRLVIWSIGKLAAQYELELASV